jgi:hypothetical protein
MRMHVSLKSKIIEIHWKNNGFWWFRRLHVRTVKVSKNKTKMRPKSIRNSMKNRYKKHARKKKAKKWKHIKKVIQKWSPNPEKWPPKIDCENWCEKGGGGVTPHPPSLTSKNPPDRVSPRKKTNIIDI